MFEIEQKYRLDEPAEFERRVAALGARYMTERVESDHYFNAPDRDFAATGEAFRIRRSGESNVLTYKGPKDPSVAVKIRPEIELDIAAGEAGANTAIAILRHLGYRPVAVVRKVRKIHQLLRDDFIVTICRDLCDHVGAFAEIEILAETKHRDRAITLIESLANELHLTKPESRSYLRMLLEASTS
jgi:adenylate cyclase, class 2